MVYEDAVARLYALGAELHVAAGEPRRKFDLQQMRALVSALGDPQRQFDSVLIAGTNGKGSTAATLASIVAASGRRTGLYTSPHLARINERIRVLAPGSIEEIEDQVFGHLFEEVEQCAEGLVRRSILPHFPSFFEVVTAMAFLHFARSGVRLAVLEVGMGGRLDATNIVDPLISVITDISLDHTEWLGSTIAAIAKEKAGILRPNGVMVTLPQHPEANQALGEAALRLGVRGVSATPYLPLSASDGAKTLPYLIEVDGEPVEFAYPLAGGHQQRNLALAIAAAMELRNNRSYDIPTRALQAGVRAVEWPGRLERIQPERGAEWLLDVAHNPAGAWSLRAALASEEVRPKTLIFGCLRDKPSRELAQILFPLFDRVILVRVDSPRAESLETLRLAAKDVGAAAECAESLPSAIARAQSLTPDEGLIVATGSVFLVGGLRALLKQEGQRRSETDAEMLTAEQAGA